MKIIFIKNVAGRGRIGEIKDVAESFAMNVLIPKKEAVIATPQTIKKIEEEKKSKEMAKELSQNNFYKAVIELEKILKEKSNNLLEIKNLKKNEKGHLFSALHEKDITEAIFQILKISFNPSQIVLKDKHIKEVGIYEVELKDKNVSKIFKIKIL